MKSFLKNNYLKLLIIPIVVILDLLTKILFYSKSFTILPGLVGSRALDNLNTGGAWSVLSGHAWLLVAISLVFLLLVFAVDIKFNIQNKLYKVAISFVIGGAVGNMIDRIFLGGVRDFIFFEFWPSYPTFNVADCFLLIGTVLLVIYILFWGLKKDTSKDEK